MGVACDCGGRCCLHTQHVLHSPAIVHSVHHHIGSSGMQGFEMPGGLLYLFFLKPFLPDLFITLSTLTNWDLPQLYLNLRGTQVLGSPHYPTVSQCL